MKASNYLWILLIAICCFSCKKESLPPNIEATPVFQLNANLDNNSVNFQAGLSDYYLFTSHEVDENDVSIFKGEFRKTSDCSSNCQESLSVEIRNFQQGNVTDTEVFELGQYDYYLDKTILPPTSFLTAAPIGNAPFTYEWVIDEELQVANTETIVYELPIGLDRQKVRLNLTDATGCTSSLEKIITRDQNQALAVNYVVEIEPVVPFVAKLKAVVENGQGPFFYQWDTGHQSPAINVLGGKYCVDVEDINGDVLQVCKTVSKDSVGVPTSSGLFSYCSADFNHVGTFAPVSNNPYQLSTVTIKYTDSNGELFSSEFKEQSASSYFEIEEVENYELNENGERTKKLALKFQCQLSNNNGTSIQLNQGIGTIAVAHP